MIEAFGGGGSSNDNDNIPVRDVEDVLRMEYRSKLLNPKWRDAMLEQGSGGAYEVSQRMTAMVSLQICLEQYEEVFDDLLYCSPQYLMTLQIGWGATTDVDDFVFDQAAERYALDEDVANKLQKANPGKYMYCLSSPISSISFVSHL